jgi:cell wall-associated NlpC family hydrolase
MSELARARVDAVARSFIGTPYHDHGEVKGAGVDCAKLLLMVYVEAGLIDYVDVGHYSPQFFLHGHEERYLGWVTRFAREIPREAAGVGDIVLYRIGHVFAHGAIVVAPGWPHIVHAHYAARRVRRGFGDSVHLGTRILDVKWFSIF